MGSAFGWCRGSQGAGELWWVVEVEGELWRVEGQGLPKPPYNVHMFIKDLAIFNMWKLKTSMNNLQLLQHVEGFWWIFIGPSSFLVLGRSGKIKNYHGITHYSPFVMIVMTPWAVNGFCWEGRTTQPLNCLRLLGFIESKLFDRHSVQQSGTKNFWSVGISSFWQVAGQKKPLKIQWGGLSWRGTYKYMYIIIYIYIYLCVCV